MAFETIKSKDLSEYVGKSIDYQTYILTENSKIKTLEESGENELYKGYYLMGMKRMERVDKTFKLNKQHISLISKRTNVKSFLVISEGWCGDAAHVLPVVKKIADYLEINFRIVYRDENPELMSEYLTDGSYSIPIIIGLDINNREVFHYGPRPKPAMDILYDFKENPDKYEKKEDFYEAIQSWYNKDKGDHIVKEIAELL